MINERTHPVDVAAGVVVTAEVLSNETYKFQVHHGLTRTRHF